MGILNVTEDSFYEGSRFLSREALLMKAGNMLEDGADILDVGAQSTRPGAEEIPQNLEKERISLAVAWIKEKYPEAIVSIDTYRSEVARAALVLGAHIINDVSGGLLDPDMHGVVAEFKVPYILMHYRGNAQSMQALNTYQHLLGDITDELLERKQKALDAGIQEVIVDPGFGFAKNIDQNYVLLKNLDYFKSLGSPILVGISRKSMIYRLLNHTPNEALNGTSFLHAFALMNGANLLRVHDVKEGVECVKLFEKLCIS
jgi:dihydropteroate synthase